MNVPINYTITLDAAIDLADRAIVAWSRRLRAGGKPPTREEYYRVIERASAMDAKRDVHGLLRLVAELDGAK